MIRTQDSYGMYRKYQPVLSIQIFRRGISKPRRNPYIWMLLLIASNERIEEQQFFKLQKTPDQQNQATTQV